jgi:hypothetical protein
VMDEPGIQSGLKGELTLRASSASPCWLRYHFEAASQSAVS